MKAVGLVIAVVAAIALTGAVLDAAATHSNPQQFTAQSTTVERLPGIVKAINNFRASEGLEPVHLEAHLNTSAQAKADDLVERHYWSHTSPDGTEPWQVIRQAGYQYRDAGENLARCYDGAQAVVDGWINSPTHRKVLLGDYHDIGIGLASDGKCQYVTAHLGSL